MRYLNMLLCLMMIGFTAVQYNDPDAIVWIVYYSVPAAWAWLAAFRLDLLRTPKLTRLLQASVVIWLGLVIFYWPEMPNFWRKEVFSVEETAREGMGLMIAWGVTVFVALTARFSRFGRVSPPESAAAKHAQA
jgi:hypothetical protein